MLHHFLETSNFGETKIHLHADNCSGQNKNRFMMQYLAWRVLTKLNKSITISFLPVGHTKFSPDWCFGLFKQVFRRTVIDCLDDIVKAVENSAAVNHAQLVGTQDGEILVATYDWAAFFDKKFKQTALQGIKLIQHFRFDESFPGVVFTRSTSDEAEQKITMLKDWTWVPSSTDLPLVVSPAGLSHERQQYLYEKIREFCRPEVHNASTRTCTFF